MVVICGTRVKRRGLRRDPVGASGMRMDELNPLLTNETRATLNVFKTPPGNAFALMGRDV